MLDVSVLEKRSCIPTTSVLRLLVYTPSISSEYGWELIFVLLCICHLVPTYIDPLKERVPERVLFFLYPMVRFLNYVCRGKIEQMNNCACIAPRHAIFREMLRLSPAWIDCGAKEMCEDGKCYHECMVLADCGLRLILYSGDIVRKSVVYLGIFIFRSEIAADEVEFIESSLSFTLVILSV